MSFGINLGFRVGIFFLGCSVWDSGLQIQTGVAGDSNFRFCDFQGMYAIPHDNARSVRFTGTQLTQFRQLGPASFAGSNSSMSGT